MCEWIKEGRKIWGKYAISSVAQMNQRVRNLESCLVEILKYSSKIFTAPDVAEKKKKATPIIFATAYDNIITAMKKHRIFDRFGFDLPKRRQPARIITMLRNYKEWFYDLKSTDWVEIDGALNLSGYQPPHELLSLLQNNIRLEV